MPSSLPQIKSLISELPTKDIRFAEKFIQDRDWESLKELTWSALQRLEIAYKKGIIPQKYEGVNVDKVRELALLCNEYYYIIYPEEREMLDNYDDAEEDI